MLDVLTGSGPTAIAYRALVAAPSTSVAELARRPEIDADTLAGALAELVELGLAVESDTGWEAVSPESAAAALQADHRRSLAAIDVQTRALARTYRDARREPSGLPSMEVLHDPVAIHEQWFRMQLDTVREIRCLERPPYLTADELDRPDLLRQIAMQAQRLEAGVEYRTIYDRSVLDDDIYGRLVVENIALGEKARTLADVPIKLVISDRRVGLLLLDQSQPRYGGGVLVLHESGLLDAWIEVFDTLWRMSVPVSDVEGEQQPLDQLDRDILSLMAVGATDDLIARRLDISRRTVVRHTAVLLQRLGATNRFQAGIQAARHGWL